MDADRTKLALKLAKLNDAVSARKLDIIKLVANFALRMPRQDVEEADLLTSVYTLLEHRDGSSALNILIMILMRLDVQRSLVDALTEHVKQTEIVLEDVDLRMMDFILTVCSVLCSLDDINYLSLKEMARRTFLPHFDPSNITSRIHLLELLLYQDCLTPDSFQYLFAWLEVINCNLYHEKLREYCRRHHLRVPEWKYLIDSAVFALKGKFHCSYIQWHL